MNPWIIVLSIATFISTLVGGLITIRFRRSLPYFFAFAAGTLVAVAFLDLLPESLALASAANIQMRYVMIAVVLSFFIYSLFERFFPSHEVDKEFHEHSHEEHGHVMGPIGASSLILHSFLDGAAIGVAFQINTAVGFIVALAVIFHDFTDGINTVTIMLRNKQKVKRARLYLLFDALAPILGVIVASIIPFSSGILSIILAVFVGEFIYIGVASLLPETYHYKSKKIILAMAAGIILIVILTGFLQI